MTLKERNRTENRGLNKVLKKFKTLKLTKLDLAKEEKQHCRCQCPKLELYNYVQHPFNQIKICFIKWNILISKHTHRNQIHLLLGGNPLHGSFVASLEFQKNRKIFPRRKIRNR